MAPFAAAGLGFGLAAAISIPVIDFLEPGAPKNSAKTTQAAIIKVVRTLDTVSTTSDPVWSVQLVVDGTPQEEMPALIGRADRQGHNRHTSGNKSPLPQGTYRIDNQGIERGPFPDPELGTGYWIPISPLFSTGRSFLGIHQDPSWGKRNGESGTSGCIGLGSAEQTKRVVDWIRQYGITKVVVES